MKASDALYYYAIFFAVVLIVTGGLIFKRTTPEVSPLWITPQEARNLMDKTSDVVVIDQSRYFYDSGHLPGALNYPKCALPGIVSSFDKGQTYIVYCHGAGAPLISANRLKGAGFKNVYALEGNYGAWLDAGYPVEN
jgi:rhodanese-related sulfurtransferase